MDIHLYHHDRQVEVLLSEILGKLNLILNQMETIMTAVDDLTTQVTANSSVIDSALVLINGIAARIEAAGVDPAKLQALVTELKTKDDALAVAVADNTPAA